MAKPIKKQRSRILKDIWYGAFCKNSYGLTIFSKISILDVWQVSKKRLWRLNKQDKQHKRTMVQ